MIELPSYYDFLSPYKEPTEGTAIYSPNILNGYRYEYKDLEEVVKTLNELLKEAYSKDEIAFALKCRTEELKTAKSDAIKEFASRLKEKYKKDFNSTWSSVYTPIDNLVKEMVSGEEWMKN